MKSYPIHNKICEELHECAYDESNLCCDGTLSGICAILCHNDIPHSFTVVVDPSDCGVDLINLWFEENQKEFHLQWYEEKSMKHLEEED